MPVFCLQFDTRALRVAAQCTLQCNTRPGAVLAKVMLPSRQFLARQIPNKTTRRNFCARLESRDKLSGLDVLFLDALRHNPHPTHSTVEESLRTVAALKPRRAFFTHISHDLLHAAVEARLPENVRIAYDGLQIPIGYGDPL